MGSSGHRRRPRLLGVTAYHHGLVHGQVGQQHVVLHDVAGHLPEGAQVSGLTVDQDLPLHARLPAGPEKPMKLLSHHETVSGGWDPPVPSQDVHEGGLPGPRGPHDGHQVPTGEFPGDPVEQSFET